MGISRVRLLLFKIKNITPCTMAIKILTTFAFVYLYYFCKKRN